MKRSALKEIFCTFSLFAIFLLLSGFKVWSILVEVTVNIYGGYLQNLHVSSISILFILILSPVLYKHMGTLKTTFLVEIIASFLSQECSDQDIRQATLLRGTKSNIHTYYICSFHNIIHGSLRKYTGAFLYSWSNIRLLKSYLNFVECRQ